MRKRTNISVSAKALPFCSCRAKQCCFGDKQCIISSKTYSSDTDSYNCYVGHYSVNSNSDVNKTYL